jgi:preprotein translocase subunit SecY
MTIKYMGQRKYTSINVNFFFTIIILIVFAGGTRFGTFQINHERVVKYYSNYRKWFISLFKIHIVLNKTTFVCKVFVKHSSNNHCSL